MRVLRVIPTIDPDVGGPSNSAVNAAIAESRLGVQTTFIFTGDASSALSTAPARERLAAAGVRSLMFPRPRVGAAQAGLWGVSLPMLGWIARHAREFEVVHLHYVWTLSTVVGAAIAKRAGCRVVLTAHESLTTYDIGTASGSVAKRRAKLALRGFIMRHVDTVVCASPLERDDSLREDERGVVIWHPVVEDPRDRPIPAPPTPPTIGYLGRLHPKKNVGVLLHAVARLPGTRLIICGDGAADHRRELEALASHLEIEDRVAWRGHVDPPGRARAFAEAHVMAMPSAYECFGMAGAESLASGVPVVVTESTGIAAVVRAYGAGAVVPVGDPAALADALSQFTRLESAPADKARSRALRASADHFSFAAYGASILRVYAGQDTDGEDLADRVFAEVS